jgi:hypothetical protein
MHPFLSMPPHRRARRAPSFSDYLRGAEYRRTGQWTLPADVLAALIRANIQSLPELHRWGRERFPTEYREYDYFSEMTGRQRTDALWAAYLLWRDGINTNSRRVS